MRVRGVGREGWRRSECLGGVYTKMNNEMMINDDFDENEVANNIVKKNLKYLTTIGKRAGFVFCFLSTHSCPTCAQERSGTSIDGII